MRCKEHKRYKGLLRPKTNCESCWRKFLDETADYNTVCKEIEFRAPKDGALYASDLFSGESVVLSMLRYRKLELEEKYNKEKKMEVVINVCFGGFGLSLKAQKEYLELKGKESYFYKQTKYAHDNNGVAEHTRIGVDDDSGLFTYAFTKDLGETYRDISNDDYNKYGFYSGDIERTDPDLIAVVKKLGEEANGSCASLRVVEIPNDIDWEIDEYDGNESIEEKHRSWR